MIVMDQQSEWAIQEIAQFVGTTSRTLRHYDEIGLLEPSRVGANGYRYYDEKTLLRLQRIMLLRELGLSLTQIAQIVDQDYEEQDVLATHLRLLAQEKQRIEKQITAVEHTLEMLQKNEPLEAESMFEGFDNTQYREEVEQRWGKSAYDRSQQWWENMRQAEQKNWMEKTQQLSNDWTALATEESADPTSTEAQALARRHVEWLKNIPGTPASDSGDTGNLIGYVKGLAELYVADERFAQNYGGVKGAGFVRDALLLYVNVSVIGDGE